MEHEAEVRGVGVSVGEEGPGAPAVVLEVDDRIVPIFVSPEQAHSMRLARDGIQYERPLTHDLFVELLTEFGGAIDRVRVDDLADGTFYAKVDAEKYEGGERDSFVFDARPSDGIALALRVDCPIVVADDVVEEAGRPATEFDVEDDRSDPEDRFR
ncbi:bifunctional nuclease family protein [Halobacteriales archaeon QS_8_69_26]|nr:MAG: bifunctional nuclease family protein [Halobacteriales archaeon QS_8_69_26]